MNNLDILMAVIIGMALFAYLLGRENVFAFLVAVIGVPMILATLIFPFAIAYIFTADGYKWIVVLIGLLIVSFVFFYYLYPELSARYQSKKDRIEHEAFLESYKLKLEKEREERKKRNS